MGKVRTDVATTTLARLLLGLLRTRAMEQGQDPEPFGDRTLTLDFVRRGTMATQAQTANDQSAAANKTTAAVNVNTESHDA